MLGGAIDIAVENKQASSHGPAIQKGKRFTNCWDEPVEKNGIQKPTEIRRPKNIQDTKLTGVPTCYVNEKSATAYLAVAIDR
jgi:hypothetical protein